MSSSQVFCDNCKSPSSLTPSEVSDSSWPESLHRHLSSWLLSPVRWPFGYLIASPYSPLQVERILPGRNWRDSFEDLLALETRGTMIDPEVRAREVKTAGDIRTSQAAERIRKLNELYWHSVADKELMEQCLAIAKRQQNHAVVETCESFIERGNQKIQRRLAFTKNILSSVNDPPPMTKISSAYSKTYGHWMASLATSGACPGWTFQLTNSTDGALWHYVKRSVPTQEVNPDIALSATEKELSEFFKDGKYFGVQDPSPSPHDQNTLDATPQGREDAIRVAASINEDEIGNHWRRWSQRPKATILQQTVFSKPSEKIQSKAGGLEVIIATQFTDGREETKEIMDDTSAVLVDVEGALGDISDQNNGLDQESYADSKEDREWRANLLAMMETAVDDEVDLGIDIGKSADGADRVDKRKEQAVSKAKFSEKLTKTLPRMAMDEDLADNLGWVDSKIVRGAEQRCKPGIVDNLVGPAVRFIKRMECLSSYSFPKVDNPMCGSLDTNFEAMAWDCGIDFRC